MSGTYKDIGVSSEGHVGVVEIQRPPHNFFDNSLINQIADAFEAFDKDNEIRAYVLCAQGKSFCILILHKEKSIAPSCRALLAPKHRQY